MKLRVVTVELVFSPQVKRRLLISGILLAVLGVAGIAASASPLKVWSDGNTLTADDLNANFAYLLSEIRSLQEQPPRATIPAARVSASAQIQVPNDDLWILDLDTEEFDTASLHGTTTGLSRLVAPVDGIYEVSGHVSWPLMAGSLELFLMADIGISYQAIASTANKASDVDPTSQSVSTIIALSEGDYVEMQVRQGSGATNFVRPVLAMAWLGPE